MWSIRAKAIASRAPVCATISAAPRVDDFDRWCHERDRRDDNPDPRVMVRRRGPAEDLDSNGTWRTDPGYGNVWVPNRVAEGWTPYQDGHWAWVDPWGWTWVDDAPWGYAVSHYGRWANLRGTWGWVPGPVAAPAVYAPALVAFIGGSNFQVSNSRGRGGAVAWFPLAPRDVYRPSYAASRGYFDRINRSNTVISTSTITNVYNTTNVTKIVYVNRQVPGAVVAVPTSAFVHSQPVAKAAVQVSTKTLARAPVTSMTHWRRPNKAFWRRRPRREATSSSIPASGHSPHVPPVPSAAVQRSRLRRQSCQTGQARTCSDRRRSLRWRPRDAPCAWSSRRSPRRRRVGRRHRPLRPLRPIRATMRRDREPLPDAHGPASPLAAAPSPVPAQRAALGQSVPRAE